MHLYLHPFMHEWAVNALVSFSACIAASRHSHLIDNTISIQNLISSSILKQSRDAFIDKLYLYSISVPAHETLLHMRKAAFKHE